MANHVVRVFDFDPAEFTGPDAGERRLCLAVLEDAIRCLLDKVVRERSEQDRRLCRREAREWIRSTDTAWPMSFEPVCEVLGLEPSYLRRALLARRPRVRMILDQGRVVVLPRAEVRRLYRAGRTVAVLAKRYRVELRAINAMVVDLARTRRSRRNREIYRLRRDARLSYAKLAGKFDLSVMQVIRVCDQEAALHARTQRRAS